MIKLASLRAAKFKQLDDVDLTFPQRGSVLIQGLNEAGKSTLFESIFFALYGKGLVTEDNSGKMDDLIHYQSPRALVRLSLTIDGGSFTVTRALNRGKANTAILDVAYANGKRENITNLTSVNKRIASELGLDGEALLNSCFVEQKKLEKIEMMTAQQRRDTLLRLLNLDRLALLEARYKPTSNDDYQLQQLRDRLKLADIQRESPVVASQLAQVEAELRLLEGVRLQRHITARRALQTEEERTQGELEAHVTQLSASLADVDSLKEVRDLARASGESLVAIEQDEQDLAQLGSEVAGLQAQAEALPLLERQLARLLALGARLAELERRDHALAEQLRDRERLLEAGTRVQRLRASLDDRQRSMAEVERELEDVQVALRQAEELEQRARTAELLRGWLQIHEVAALAGEAEGRLSDLRQNLFEVQQIAAEHEADRAIQHRLSLGLAVAVVCTLLFGAALSASGHLLGLLAIVPAAALAFAFAKTRRAVRQAAAALARARADIAGVQIALNREEGAQALAQRTNQDPRRLAEIEAELAALDAIPPTSAADAQAQLESLEAGMLAGDSSHAARQRLGALEGRQQALWADIREIKAAIEREGDPEAATAELDRVIASEQALLAAERTNLVPEAMAGTASLAAGEQAPADSDPGTVRDEVRTAAEAREQAATVRAARQAAADAAAKAGAAAASLAARQQRLDQRAAEFERTWAELSQRRPNLPPTVDDCRTLWRTCGEQITQLDEPGLRRRMNQVSQGLAASQERAAAASREAAELTQQLDSLALDERQLAARADAPRDDTSALIQTQRDLIERRATLQDRQSALELQLGLQGVPVDYPEAQQALDQFAEQCDVRRQAYRIISLARKNIVTKVLPSTMRNMRMLLPLLTNDRYRDVDISDDYKIRVWDDSARALKAKDIFSGGTRDQFSLALRLAFALATLPEELGSAPGFIFLDEPLSSFDDARTEALVNLLTRGLIAENFEQIFVISHNRTFDEQLFDYHLQLDNGHIVASDLPATPDAEVEPKQLDLTALSPSPSGRGLG